ncbi:MarR family transcriptional regulator [Staphylococcus sp. 18_1_E_LY]|uniref:MarR family transcriptional regulator n=1 Tax=Staphylococcus lloydii TaxID=2781774 RepID=A0A7T1F8Q6_9STAP|nr:MarR family transcriptional regulator [Staphylococcus lloydii]MBF7019047.1 MarR family transcriptional regulator [Staphylococcus lloydii]MBF7026775.1 MarR family transcriptional regulator [Staphylococcus lloydii]MDU9417330.1 MarR family transcriptional regulator [Staphylococcus lloydii]QPM74432.1 MarR family transcriptional regulator [Staphylococcus lloydii]
MYKQLEKLLTHTSNELNLVSRRFGQYTELSPEQIELLTIVFNHSKLSQYELTMKLNKEQSIVSRWIKKLCKLGYLKSVQNKSDLRCKDIILTEKSRLLIQQIINRRVELIEARCHGLTEEDIQRFKILLMKVAGRYQCN